ncbi:uncharacterized protein C2orf72 homolog [Gopherus flavomarginatus]|uniref:uncharacterized protein C2orf72 homolog n=1 Tax=Gopherus flavomarginatus TaxID=286002 RepID=UPI0021CBB472|nr:uncharacterized protein C2orf72 homolog [Gopherus flavomarginatus]
MEGEPPGPGEQALQEFQALVELVGGKPEVLLVGEVLEAGETRALLGTFAQELFGEQPGPAAGSERQPGDQAGGGRERGARPGDQAGGGGTPGGRGEPGGQPGDQAGGAGERPGDQAGGGGEPGGRPGDQAGGGGTPGGQPGDQAGGAGERPGDQAGGGGMPGGQPGDQAGGAGERPGDQAGGGGMPGGQPGDQAGGAGERPGDQAGGGGEPGERPGDQAGGGGEPEERPGDQAGGGGKPGGRPEDQAGGGGAPGERPGDQAGGGGKPGGRPRDQAGGGGTPPRQVRVCLGPGGAGREIRSRLIFLLCRAGSLQPRRARARLREIARDLRSRLPRGPPPALVGVIVQPGPGEEAAAAALLETLLCEVFQGQRAGRQDTVQAAAYSPGRPDGTLEVRRAACRALRAALQHRAGGEEREKRRFPSLLRCVPWGRRSRRRGRSANAANNLHEGGLQDSKEGVALTGMSLNGNCEEASRGTGT